MNTSGPVIAGTTSCEKPVCSVWNVSRLLSARRATTRPKPKPPANSAPRSARGNPRHATKQIGAPRPGEKESGRGPPGTARVGGRGNPSGRTEPPGQCPYAPADAIRGRAHDHGPRVAEEPTAANGPFSPSGSRDLVPRSSRAQPVPTRRPWLGRRADSHRHRAGSRPSPAPELCEVPRRATWRIRRPGQAGWQLGGGGRRLRRPSLLSREGPALRWPGGTDSRCPQRSARASPAPRAVRPAGRARQMSPDLRRRRALHQDHASSSARGGEPRLRVGSGHPLAGHRGALSERTDLQEGPATFFLSRR
jgi:hypothetical protein